MNIERVVDNLKDNALPLTLGVGACVVFYLLLSGKNEEAVLVPATGYTSYPDAVTNANVIIGEVNDHTTTEINELKEGHDSILENMLSQTEYYREGLQQVLDKADTSTHEVMGAIQTQQDLLGDIKSNQNQNHASLLDIINQGTLDIQATIGTSTGALSNKIDASTASVQSSVSQVQSSNNVLSNAVNTLKNTVNKVTTVKTVTTNKTTSNPKTSGTTSKKTGTTSKKTGGTYTYATKSGLNTSTSIVDALKAIGVNSSMSNREKIAKVNGIKNYTGSASQNISLLNKLKSGTLKKV